MKKIDIVFVIILIIQIINNKIIIISSRKLHNNNKPILNLKQSELFELIELSIIILLLIYSILNLEYVNGFMFIIIFIEHILQLLYCYRIKNQYTKLSIMCIYITLLIYNIITYKYIFVILWVFAIFIHLVSYYYNTRFMEIICMSNYININ